jgi:hypothetical protein
MRWNEVNFHPTPPTLRQFALLWLAFFGALAIWSEIGNDHWPALVLGALALVGGICGLIQPRLLRPIYVGWMVSVYPLGLAVSYVLLAVLYFGLITPLGLIMRIVGRDPLQRRARLECDTYWLPKLATTAVQRYFRPY